MYDLSHKVADPTGCLSTSEKDLLDKLEVSLKGLFQKTEFDELSFKVFKSIPLIYGTQIH